MKKRKSLSKKSKKTVESVVENSESAPSTSEAPVASTSEAPAKPEATNRPRPSPSSEKDEPFAPKISISFINDVPTEMIVHWGMREEPNSKPLTFNRYAPAFTAWRPLLQHRSVTGIQQALISPVVAFFPGNPGAIEAYGPFLKFCYEACAQQVTFIGVGYAGHSSTSFQQKIFDLPDQIQHKRYFVEQALALFPETTPIFLMGHSIGAFIASKLTSQNPRIKGCINLFPTLTDLNKTISPSVQLIASPLVHPAFHFLFHTVLAPFRKLIATKLATDTAGVDLIDDKKIHNPTFSENVLQLSRSEAQIVRQEMDADIQLIINGDKMVFLFSDTDKYNLDHPKRYKLDGKDNVTQISMDHAFIIDADNSKWVANWISRKLQKQFKILPKLALNEEVDLSKARRKRSRDD